MQAHQKINGAAQGDPVVGWQADTNAGGTDSIPIIVSLFSSVQARDVQTQDSTWGELTTTLEQAASFKAKTDLPLLKMARFGAQRTERGSLRHDGNVEAVSGIEGDYDAGHMTVATAVELLEKAGVEAFVYSTPSYTNDAPRWRVLAPLSKPVLPTERAKFTGRLNCVLNGVLARESFVVSQSYYCGRVDGVPYLTHRVKGVPIDLLDTIGEVYPDQKQKQSNGKIPEGGRHNHMTALAGRLRAKGATAEEILAALRAENSLCEPPLPDDEIARIASDIAAKPAGTRDSLATALVRFVVERYELFHDKANVTYAQERATGEVRRLDSRLFRDAVRAAFYKTEQKSIADAAVNEAMATVNGLARHEGKTETVHLRVAEKDGTYYVDLCEPGSSRCIQIDATGWKIIDKAPVAFVRAEPMQALPEPVAGGDIDTLWQYANIPEECRLLVVAWLVECMRPGTPKPLLEILGEQGSAKSTTQKVVRRLIDPNASDLRALPKSPHDLFVGAQSSAVVSFENVSHIPAGMQDALCILATEGSYSTRTLYSDADETVLHAQRPVVINGIVPVVTQPDLLDRAISIEVERVKERREVATMLAAFDADRPRLLGALLTTFSRALELLPTIALANPPRLVEFARLGAAVAVAMGLQPETFAEAFADTQAAGIARTLDASPVTAAILAYIENYPETSERAANAWSFLLQGSYRGDGWPKTPHAFGGALRRAVPVLRSLGIEVKSLGKTGGTIRWSIGRLRPAGHQDFGTSFSKVPGSDL